ncbi:glycine cleavage system H protein [Desulforamulus reducens MI-1]|uniref:Glycine cleavage system H protein n=1 Tax=Desulforamulus reducens (strain ATCC BAA-1160 / DSM 100696 / MI-1) TaxID=349161 RepID=A4J242_DESRM|nr:glycine cleavage system protein GcvH [Desulforamulus reducens]ABO49145.1 glycine cleavage system H protein [Desulforamulus reducens MI-1]
MTKPITELTFLNGIHYFHEHTWAKVEGDLVKVGITDFAQDSLGNIIFVELPNEGETFSKGDEFGQAESAKTVSALYMPVSGEIVEVNSELEEAPQNVNEDPYGSGWMIIVKPSNLDEVKELLSKEEYLNQIK